MNLCTFCSSKYSFLLNDCFFENDQIACFRVDVIKNISHRSSGFVLKKERNLRVLKSIYKIWPSKAWVDGQ
jgi:hypothetical protein